MPVFVSPGVYTTIIDLSLYVPNLATTIAGIVGAAKKGPTDEAIFVSNVLSFVTTFGEPDPNFFGPYAALQFLRYGRSLYYVRVAGDSAAKSTIEVYEGTTSGFLQADVAGPYVILSADNNAFEVSLDVDGPAGAVAVASGTLLLSKGVSSTADVVAEMQSLIDASPVGTTHGVGSVVVAEEPDGTISLSSLLPDTDAILSLTAEGGAINANTTLGFAAAGESDTGADATVATISTAAIATTGTYNVATTDDLIFTIDGTVYTINFPSGVYTADEIRDDINGDVAFSGAGHVASTVVLGGGQHNVLISADGSVPGPTSTILVSNTLISNDFGLDLVLHTGAAAEAATFKGGASGPFVFGANNVLQLSFDAGPFRPVPFVPSPLTPGVMTASEVVAAINTVVGTSGFNEGVARVNVDGTITITSLTSGTASSVLASQTTPTGSGHFALNTAANAADWVSTAGIGTGTPATLSFIVDALYVGTYGNDLTVLVSKGQNPGTFKLNVFDGERQVDAHDNLVLSPDTDPNYIETVINDVSTWISIRHDALVPTLPPAVGSSWALAGGDDGVDASLTDADYIGVNLPGEKTGLQLFAESEERDLNMIMVPGVSSAAVINEMLLICETRADCMALIDPPFGLTVQQVVDWHNGAPGYDDHAAFNSFYGALYWPWLEVFDAVNDQKIFVPPSGLVAGQFAFTDFNTETWFAPAGLNRGVLLQPLRLEYSADLGERDLMYGNLNAVNPIVKFLREGIVIWGQKSLLRKPSALDRVNVVRLVLFLRKAIATAVRSLVFEPNDPVTWATFVNITEPFLESIKQRRGLVDFRVLCDETTNPPDAIDRNEMHAIVAFKPVKAAEFLEIRFAVVAQAVAFDDLTF